MNKKKKKKRLLQTNKVIVVREIIVIIKEKRLKNTEIKSTHKRSNTLSCFSLTTASHNTALYVNTINRIRKRLKCNWRLNFIYKNVNRRSADQPTYQPSIHPTNPRERAVHCWWQRTAPPHWRRSFLEQQQNSIQFIQKMLRSYARLKAANASRQPNRHHSGSQQKTSATSRHYYGK